jgi:hypothetical protein
MNELQELIHSLDASEKKSLHYFLKCLGAKANSEKKLIQLFNIFSKLKTNPSSNYLIKKLDLKDNNSLNVLKFRLKQKIFDLIILDNNIEKHKLQDNLNFKSVKLRKKLTQLNYIIRNKGTLKLIESELNSLINESIKYEIYSIAIDALELKKNLYVRKKGLKEFHKINNQINVLIQKEKNFTNALDFQTYFVASLELKNNLTDNEIINELKEKIIELNDALEKYPSAFLKFLIKIFENYYFTINENFETAREVCLENLNLIKKSPSLLNNQRIGSAYIDLYTIDVNLKEYKRALNNIKSALKYFPKYSLNYYKTIETKMMVNCYLKQYKNALNEIKNLSKLSSPKYAPQYEKLNYYKVYVLFLKKEYTKANTILNYGINLPIDKEGNDIYLRLIHICVLISLNKIIQAIEQTNNLIRHYNRFHSKKNKNERINNLVSLFKYLSKQDFTEIKLNEKLEKTFNSLLHDKASKWAPLSPELYPIDKWVIGYYQLNLSFEEVKKKEQIQKINFKLLKI